MCLIEMNVLSPPNETLNALFSLPPNEKLNALFSQPLHLSYKGECRLNLLFYGVHRTNKVVSPIESDGHGWPRKFIPAQALGLVLEFTHAPKKGDVSHRNECSLSPQ